MPARLCAAAALSLSTCACPCRRGHAYHFHPPFFPSPDLPAPQICHHAAAALSSLLRCLQVSAMMKKHLVEGVVPVLIELKRALEGQQHWLLRDLLAAIRMLLKDYKHEVSEECTQSNFKIGVGQWLSRARPARQPSASLRTCCSTHFSPAVPDSTTLALLQIEDILVADKQLAREIMYDLRQDEQRAAAAAAGQSCAPPGGCTGAGPSGQGAAAQSSEGPSGSGQPAQQSARPGTHRRQERSRAGGVPVQQTLHVCALIVRAPMDEAASSAECEAWRRGGGPRAVGQVGQVAIWTTPAWGLCHSTGSCVGLSCAWDCHVISLFLARVCDAQHVASGSRKHPTAEGCTSSDRPSSTC